MVVTVDQNACKDLTTLYTGIANAAGIELPEGHMFNCTKVNVSREVQDLVFDFYKSRGGDNVSIGMLWVCSGPKAVEWLTGFDVDVEPGFVVGGNNE